MKSLTVSLNTLAKVQYDIKEEKQNLFTLHDLVNRGIIDSEVLQMQQQNMEDKLLQAVKEIHKAKISYRSESAGKGRPPRRFYITQFNDPVTGKPVKVKAHSECGLFEKLVKRYGLDLPPVEQVGTEAAPAEKSLAVLLPSWVEYRKRFVDDQTRDKDLWCWNKYYKDDPITFKSIPTLSLAEIKTWLADKITECHLTKRQFREMKGVWNSIEQYAVEAEIIQPGESKIRHARNFTGFAYDAEKPDELLTYTKEEKKSLIELCMKYYHMHNSSSYLAVILSFFFGVRVGEMVCLRYEDFDWEDTQRLYVNQMERQGVTIEADLSRHRNGYQVMDNLKANWRCRDLPIPTGARVVVDFIKAEQEKQGIVSDYLFTRDDGERRHKEDVTKALKRVCEKLGIPDKTGLHESRRTYASELIDSGEFSEREIMAMMGHRDYRTTQKYYNRAIKEKTTTANNAVTQAVGIPLPVLWSNVG